ncbi:MAG: hypothetical protein ABSA79_06590 [Candidatus Bathyarchaeia archaeon]
MSSTDLGNELEKHKEAADFLKTLNKSDVYIIIFLIETTARNVLVQNQL